jgi:PucR family transcriptional regulator, purine catabolism regulatory protein
MTVHDALALKSLTRATVVAGKGGLERDVQWAHVVDMPDPAPWVRTGQLLLTTGFAWPTQERDIRSLVRLLAGKGLAAVGLAVPGYLKKFPETARAEADRLNLPLIEIPFEIPFAQITEELHGAILAQQYSVIERSEHIHRALTRAAAEGSSLSDLARTLGELLGRSVTFEDPEGKLLASFSKANDAQDPIRRQTLEEQQSPAHLTVALESAGFTSEIRRSSGAIRIPAMPELGLDTRVVCPIRLGSELAGLVWIIEGENELSELDLRAAEHAALVAAVNIAHQRELSTIEARLGYASFLSILEGEDDHPQAIERARLVGFEPSGSHRVGICVIPEPLPLAREGFLHRERVAAHLTSLLKAAATKPLVTATLNRVVFLLPQGVDAQSLWSGLDDRSLRIVLGRAHPGTAGARHSYREAQSLLTYLDGSTVRIFEEALVPRVLMGDASAHDAFIDHVFGKLRKRKDGATLEAVLRALAKHGFSLKSTAKALGIHQNTLRYRLGKALEVLRLDLSDPEARFALQLAAKILDFSTKT